MQNSQPYQESGQKEASSHRRELPQLKGVAAKYQHLLSTTTFFASSTPRSSPNGNPIPSLKSLGSDIWFQIALYLPKPSLISLLQTSSQNYTFLTPLLYDTVDLSTHISPPSCPYPPASPRGISHIASYNRQICEKQYSFLHQIARNPALGQYVRVLKWTFGLEDERLGFVPSFRPGERVLWRRSEREAVFRFLGHVESLDVECVGNGEEILRRGRGLFPGVGYANLHGITNITSILSSGTTPLSSLYLGPYRSAQDSLTAISSTSSPRGKYPSLNDPSLHLRCKNLQTLSITLHPSNPEYDTELLDFYISLAACISEVRPRSFVFKLVDDVEVTGMALNQWGSRDKKGMKRLQRNVFPEVFCLVLLPVLVKGWEGLRRVEVRGVGGRLLKEMREKLGARGVLVVVDREGT